MNKPKIIEGMHTMKNFFKPFQVLTLRFLFESLITNILMILVSIDNGSRIKRTSKMLYPINNK